MVNRFNGDEATMSNMRNIAMGQTRRLSMEFRKINYKNEQMNLHYLETYSDNPDLISPIRNQDKSPNSISDVSLSYSEISQVEFDNEKTKKQANKINKYLKKKEKLDKLKGEMLLMDQRKKYHINKTYEKPRVFNKGHFLRKEDDSSYKPRYKYNKDNLFYLKTYHSPQSSTENNFFPTHSKVCSAYLSTNTAKRRILSVAVGLAMPSINSRILRDFKVVIPSNIEEQKKISQALSAIDEFIFALETQIAKKKQIKEGTMQQLLTGKKRLPGFDGEWVEIKLGEIADIRTGKRNGDENVEFGRYPFFVRSQTVYRINSYSYDGEAILVPGEGGIGSIFHYINGKFDFHQRVYKISDFNENVAAKFIFYYMKKFFGPYAMMQSVKATVDSLRLPTFQEFDISMPKTKEEQIAIANILSDMEEEIKTLEEERDKYLLIKQGMMQDLLTGKTRLK